ncbi:CRISPR system precrRNA processing endoribonuclease RAMP protein Cas6, partial [Vibrio sp. 10N.222.55.C6]
LTPLRLKQNSNIVKKQAPELKFWVNQSLRRLTQLGRFWVNDNQELFDRVYQHTLDSIPNNVDWQSHCYFEDWMRYSRRHGKALPIGGLKGQVSFYGDLEALIPILKIGELLQVGGKTTFGLGKYRLIA